MDALQSGDPQQIGPYWLEGRLGSGGMGRVYLGRSPGGRYVAIKVIRSDLAENADFRTRFAREASAARKVSGIFTAPVVDADLDGPVPWLATSYIAGPSLTDRVARRGPMATGLVLRLAAGLAEGLAAIHSVGVVHRDLKPSNVLLAEDGPRLIDFGISRSVDTSSMTRTGMVVGSPGFMSPEQAEGHEVGPASDIFSLGAVLTFAATGEGPFGEGSTVALLYRVVWSEPNTQGVPQEIRPLVERCLAKDPRQRPTAAQLLARLSTVAVVADPAREGTTRKAALFRPTVPPRQSPPPQAPPPQAAQAPHQGQVPHQGQAPYQAQAPAYPATQQAAVPPTRPGGGQDERPTLSPPELPPAYYEPAYYQPVTEGERHHGERGPGTGRRHGGRLMAVAAVVVLAVGAVTFLAVRDRPGSPGTANPSVTSAAANSSPATPLPGASAMATLGSYLARSATARQSVEAAIDDVQNCSESPASAEATFQQSISTRQGILQGLKTLNVSGLPNGAQLVSALTTAMQNSLDADEDYQAWMADLVNSGNTCGSNSSQDPNYVAGGNASTAATASKNAFVAIWNPMAPRYGQQTYTSTGF